MTKATVRYTCMGEINDAGGVQGWRAQVIGQSIDEGVSWKHLHEGKPDQRPKTVPEAYIHPDDDSEEENSEDEEENEMDGD